MFNHTKKDPPHTKALYAALDAAAPDKEHWFAGEEAFNDAEESRLTIDESLTAALDAAALDDESWRRGWDEFSAQYSPSWRQTMKIISDAAFSRKQLARKQPPTERNDR